ncbi:hypothetical protein BH24ACT3_BH24ACT3_09040 [soil metagenome]
MRTMLHATGGRDHRRQWLLAAATVTLLLEILGLAGVVDHVVLGRINLSPSLPASFLVAALAGTTIVGRRTDGRAALAYWVMGAVVLAGAGLAFARVNDPADVTGVILAGFNEELVYRLAVPMAVAVVLMVVGMGDRLALAAGFVLAGVWFVLLPGHRSQITEAGDVASYLAFAALSAIIAYRSAAVLAAGLVHVVVNLLTLLMWQGELSPGVRSAVIGGLLALLVLAYGVRVPTRERGMVDVAERLAPWDLARSREPVIIDLRERIDLTTVPIEAPLPRRYRKFSQ